MRIWEILNPKPRDQGVQVFRIRGCCGFWYGIDYCIPSQKELHGSFWVAPRILPLYKEIAIKLVLRLSGSYAHIPPLVEALLRFGDSQKVTVFLTFAMVPTADARTIA